MTTGTQTSALLKAVTQLMADPDFDAVVADLGMRIFAPYGNRLKLLQSLDRFLAKGTRFQAYSLGVGTAQPVKLLERDVTRIAAMIFNLGANTIYVGGHSVVPAITAVGDPNGGFPILSNGMLRPTDLVDTIAEIWAIAAVGTNDVRVVDIAG